MYIQSVGPLKVMYTSPLGRPVHSDTNSASQGSILAMQQLRAKTKSLTFPPLSIARYSFTQLSQLGRQWREQKFPIFETVAKGDSNQGSLDCKSGILPLNYLAPQMQPMSVLSLPCDCLGNVFVFHTRSTVNLRFSITKIQQQ